MGSTHTEPAPLVKLLSPFNGLEWTVPPEHATPAFIDELLRRGFTRVEADADTGKKKGAPK